MESTLVIVLINMLLAWGLWFPLFGGQLALATSGFAAVGAYTAAEILIHGGGLPLALVGAAGAGVIASLPISVLALRLPGFTFALASFGAAESVRIAVGNVSSLGGAYGLVGVPTVGGVLTAAIVAVCVVIALSWLLVRSDLGRQFDVVRNDELQARALGIRVGAIKFFAIGAGGVVAASAGGLLVGFARFVEPSQFGLDLIAQLLAFVVVGGTTTFWGPLIGAAGLTLISQELSGVGGLRNVLFGLVLVVMILARPDGVLRRSRFLQRRRMIFAASLSSVERSWSAVRRFGIRSTPAAKG